jgi:hypothetical protein
MSPPKDKYLEANPITDSDQKQEDDQLQEE